MQGEPVLPGRRDADDAVLRGEARVLQSARREGSQRAPLHDGHGLVPPRCSTRMMPNEVQLSYATTCVLTDSHCSCWPVLVARCARSSTLRAGLPGATSPDDCLCPDGWYLTTPEGAAEDAQKECQMCAAGTYAVRRIKDHVFQLSSPIALRISPRISSLLANFVFFSAGHRCTYPLPPDGLQTCVSERCLRPSQRPRLREVVVGGEASCSPCPKGQWSLPASTSLETDCKQCVRGEDCYQSDEWAPPVSGDLPPLLPNYMRDPANLDAVRLSALGFRSFPLLFVSFVSSILSTRVGGRGVGISSIPGFPHHSALRFSDPSGSQGLRVLRGLLRDRAAAGRGVRVGHGRGGEPGAGRPQRVRRVSGRADAPQGCTAGRRRNCLAGTEWSDLSVVVELQTRKTQLD